jgi:hypothetical protein
MRVAAFESRKSNGMGQSIVTAVLLPSPTHPAAYHAREALGQL